MGSSEHAKGVHCTPTLYSSLLNFFATSRLTLQKAVSISSGGMIDSTPLNAIYAADIATAANMPLRLTQGQDTVPMGSHIRPMLALQAIAKAWAHISGVPPLRSVNAAAAMAAALPHSAWQPPTEPERVPL